MQFPLKLVIDHYGTACRVVNNQGAKIAIVSRFTRRHEQDEVTRLHLDQLRLLRGERINWRRKVRERIRMKAESRDDVYHAPKNKNCASDAPRWFIY